MLKRIEVSDFKCFEKLKIDFKSLCLLVGTNSAGKSTLIQSLLLAIQNITYKKNSPLNGHLVSIGSFSEARNFITNAKTFTIKLINDDNGSVILTFTEDNTDNCKCVIKNSKPFSIKKVLNYENKQIHYLSAKRIGSEDVYRKNYDKYDEFGLMGEFAIDYFEKNKNFPLKNLALLKDPNSQTLGNQLNYWLRYILNSELATEDIKGTDNVKAQYALKNSRTVRPKNTGTGLSYIISILIMGLSCKINDILIIENPEIHLHPRAQSRLTDFLVFLSTNGIQLIVETHSDHIFNGIRKSILRKSILPEQVSINYFYMSGEKHISQHEQILLSSSGKIEKPINGLFDQFDEDLNDLLGLS